MMMGSTHHRHPSSTQVLQRAYVQSSSNKKSGSRRPAPEMQEPKRWLWRCVGDILTLTHSLTHSETLGKWKWHQEGVHSGRPASDSSPTDRPAPQRGLILSGVCVARTRHSTQVGRFRLVHSIPWRCVTVH